MGRIQEQEGREKTAQGKKHMTVREPGKIIGTENGGSREGQDRGMHKTETRKTKGMGTFRNHVGKQRDPG